MPSWHQLIQWILGNKRILIMHFLEIDSISSSDF